MLVKNYIVISIFFQSVRKRDNMIISIDHGYGMIKTPNSCFKTGIAKYDNEPYTKTDVIKYKDKFYVCGSGRQSLVRDKTADESYYILTLMAIAKELDYKGAGNRANITLACGLPLTSFGRDKLKLREYLMKSSFQPVKFTYEGRKYRVTIDNVLMYPQGYSAIIDFITPLKKEASLILCDIGSWTVDVMRLDKGVPNANSCRSLELGTIRMTDEILEQVRRSTGLSITQSQVEQVLSYEPCSINEKAKDVIIEQGKQYVKTLTRTLLESGFDTSAIPILFIGGGSFLVQKNIDKYNLCSLNVDDSMREKLEAITGDIKANAKGYEKIAIIQQSNEK